MNDSVRVSPRAKASTAGLVLSITYVKVPFAFTVRLP